MARKKAEDTPSEEGVEKEKKTTKKKIIIPQFQNAQDIIDIKKMVIPISPAYDLYMGGGLQEGTWNIVGGPASCGKTTLIMHMCKQILKHKPNAHIFWGDAEFRLQSRNLDIQGLDRSRFTVIRSTEDRIMMAEDFLEEFDNILRNVKDAVLVIDSISTLCPINIDEAGYREGVMTTKANLLFAMFVRKMAQVVPLKNSIVIGVNQIMANPSGYGAAFKEKAVTQSIFQADNKLRCIKSEEIKDGAKVVGQDVIWKPEKTCLPGALTNTPFNNILYYGKGIYEEAELLRMAIDFNVVEKAGSWLAYEDKELVDDKNEAIIYKWQGEANFLRGLEENPDVMAKMRKEVLDLVK